MADSLLKDLTSITTPASDDLLYLVHDPSGTPVDRKLTVGDLGAAIGGGGGGGGVTTAHTIYVNGSDYSTSSTTFVDIDATNLPGLALTLAIGDLVELTFSANWAHSNSGYIIGFDWLIDRPTSGDTNLRGAGYAAAALELGSANHDGDSNTIYGLFVATEAGLHSFKPQWRTGGGTASIVQTGAYAGIPIFHAAKNLG